MASPSWTLSAGAAGDHQQGATIHPLNHSLPLLSNQKRQQKLISHRAAADTLPFLKSDTSLKNHPGNVRLTPTFLIVVVGLVSRFLQLHK